MNNAWKSKILPALLAGTLTFSFGAAVDAKGNGNGNGNGKGKANGNGNAKFKVEKSIKLKDMENHWAKGAVTILVQNQIINGYADSTFKPNKPVTQLEAVTMVMNLLTQKKDLLEDGDSYIGKDIPNWAKDSVKLALINDVVSWEDLQPNKPATRMFVIKLLVNALGAEFDNVDGSNLFFGDIASLDSEEKAYLSFALLQSLVQGYEDKTFKPNKPVTRAEMAIFVNNLFGKFDDIDFDFDLGSRINGTISEIDTDDEELKIGSKTYEISDDAVVKIDGDSAKFDDLAVGMRVNAILKDNVIQTIYAYTDDSDEEVEFKIEKISDGKEAVEFKEAVKKSSRLDDDNTPDLSDETLYVVLNEEIDEAVELDGIDGDEDDWDEVAEELEQAIADALDADDRVRVSFDDNEDRLIFETNDSPRDEVPSIKFTGSALNELGLDTTIAKGTLENESESWKITVESDATEDETYVIHFEDEDIDEEVEIDVDDNDTAEEIADKIADALYDIYEIRSAYTIEADDDEVTVTSKTAGEDLDVEIKITKK